MLPALSFIALPQHRCHIFSLLAHNARSITCYLRRARPPLPAPTPATASPRRHKNACYRQHTLCLPRLLLYSRAQRAARSPRWRRRSRLFGGKILHLSARRTHHACTGTPHAAPTCRRAAGFLPFLPPRTPPLHRSAHLPLYSQTAWSLTTPLPCWRRTIDRQDCGMEGGGGKEEGRRCGERTSHAAGRLLLNIEPSSPYRVSPHASLHLWTGWCVAVVYRHLQHLYNSCLNAPIVSMPSLASPALGRTGYEKSALPPPATATLRQHELDCDASSTSIISPRPTAPMSQGEDTVQQNSIAPVMVATLCNNAGRTYHCRLEPRTVAEAPPTTAQRAARGMPPRSARIMPPAASPTYDICALAHAIHHRATARACRAPTPHAPDASPAASPAAHLTTYRLPRSFALAPLCDRLSRIVRKTSSLSAYRSPAANASAWHLLYSLIAAVYVRSPSRHLPYRCLLVLPSTSTTHAAHHHPLRGTARHSAHALALILNEDAGRYLPLTLLRSLPSANCAPGAHYDVGGSRQRSSSIVFMQRA